MNRQRQRRRKIGQHACSKLQINSKLKGKVMFVLDPDAAATAIKKLTDECNLIIRHGEDEITFYHLTHIIEFLETMAVKN